MVSSKIHSFILGCMVAVGNLPEVQGAEQQTTTPDRSEIIDQSMKAASKQDTPSVELDSYVLNFGLSDGKGYYPWSAETSYPMKALNNVGVNINAQTDIFVGYDAPLFWNYRQATNWLVFSPNIYAKASAIGELTLSFQIIDVIFKLEVIGFKFTPLEQQWAVDMDKYRMCSSTSWYQDVFDILFSIDYNIQECSVGAIGSFLEILKIDLGTGSTWNDCAWRKYEPETPLYQYTIFDQGDQTEDYLPWKCSDYFELQTIDAQTDEDGNDPFNPVDFDDGSSNAGFEYDPSNVVIE